MEFFGLDCQNNRKVNLQNVIGGAEGLYLLGKVYYRYKPSIIRFIFFNFKKSKN